MLSLNDIKEILYVALSEEFIDLGFEFSFPEPNSLKMRIVHANSAVYYYELDSKYQEYLTGKANIEKIIKSAYVGVLYCRIVEDRKNAQKDFSYIVEPERTH